MTARRSVRLLQALEQNPEGLLLVELVAAIGESGRKSSAATVTMLKNMRDAGRVDYTDPVAPRSGAGLGQSEQPGRAGGIYSITAAGRAWLRRIADLPALSIPELEPLPLETGAMRGEEPTVVWRAAEAGQAPVGAVSFVFDLALR